MYQVIYRLKGFGYHAESRKVMSEDNRVRIYFAITDSGRDYLTALIENYHVMTGAIEKFFLWTEKLTGR